MSRFHEDVEDSLKDMLKRARHPCYAVADDVLSRNRYTNRDFDEVLDRCIDVAELSGLERERSERKMRDALDALVQLVVGDWVWKKRIYEDDRNMTDREIDEIEDISRDFEGILDKLEDNGRDRRRGRDRDDDRRRGRGRADRNDRNRSRRGGRSRRDSRDRDDDRNDHRRENQRNRRTANIHDARAERERDREDEEYERREARRNERARREEEAEQPRAKRTTSTPVTLPQTANEIAEKKPIEFVGEEKVREVIETDGLTPAEAELGFAYTEVPIGDVADYEELGIDITDPNFIITRPVSPMDLNREVVYDPYTRQPVWTLSGDGLRVLKFVEVSMDATKHMIPDFKRIKGLQQRQSRDSIITALAQPSRRSVLDIENDANARDKKLDQDIKDWEEQSAALPEAEREPKPQPAPLVNLDDKVVKIDDDINGESFGAFFNRTMAESIRLQKISTGNPVIESAGEIVKVAHILSTKEERDEVLKKIEMFTDLYPHTRRTGTNQTASQLIEYHAALTGLVDQIPHGLWRRLNLRLTEYVNDLLTVNLGTSDTIDDFFADMPTLFDDVANEYGKSIGEALAVGHYQNADRLAFIASSVNKLDVDPALRDTALFESRRTHMTVLPISPDELGLSSISPTDSQPRSVYVGEDGASRLQNALRTVYTQGVPLSGKLIQYRYLAFADGMVYRIDRNAIGLTGTDRRRNAHWILTPVNID